MFEQTSLIYHSGRLHIHDVRQLIPHGLLPVRGRPVQQLLTYKPIVHRIPHHFPILPATLSQNVQLHKGVQRKDQGG
jgi:hypothetical protein